MTLVVIDASAGVEIVCDTRRGRALARLLPVGAEGWVQRPRCPPASVLYQLSYVGRAPREEFIGAHAG